MAVVLSPSQRLAAAEQALHQLQIGGLPVEIEHDGRRVRYNRATIEELRGYVDRLRLEVAGVRPRKGGLTVLFT